MFGNNKNSLTQEQIDEILAPLQERMDDLQKRVELLEKSNKALAQQLSDLQQSQPVASQTEDDGTGPVTVELSTEITDDSAAVQKPREETVYYLPAPTPEGEFPSASTSEEMGKSLYRLVTTDGRNGHFSIIDSSDAIALAVISISQFIKPVCKIDGRTQYRPQHIHTLEEGTAQKDGDVWRVVRKAVVRFA